LISPWAWGVGISRLEARTSHPQGPESLLTSPSGKPQSHVFLGL
jgi:hypothetical protein